MPQGKSIGKRFRCIMLAPDLVYIVGGTVEKKATNAVY